MMLLNRLDMKNWLKELMKLRLLILVIKMSMLQKLEKLKRK